MLPAARVNGFAKRPERATPITCDDPTECVESTQAACWSRLP